MENGAAESETYSPLTDGTDQVNSTETPTDVSGELKKLLTFKVYRRRWFVLLVLCLLNCSNATVWLTFAPIANETASFLAVSLEWINWLSLVYMVVAIPLSFGTTWMLDVLGLRITLIVGSWLNMAGALVRFFGTTLPQQTHQDRYAIIMVGQTLGALAQPLIIFTPTKLAALWFPEHQRATANMIASMSNPLGLLLVNIISPALSLQYRSIPIITLVYTVPAGLICLLATVGIRSSAPPTPPSASAESSHEPFLHGLRLLIKNKAYIILLLCFGAGIACFTCFTSLLDQILCVQGYTSNFAGLCGALFIVSGILGAGILGLYVDKTKKFTEAIKINMSLSALSCIAFSVVALMHKQQIAIAVVCCAFGFFGFSVFPIAMELSVECSYPVGVATTSGLIFASGQIQSVLYMILLQGLTTPLSTPPDSTCGDSPQSWRVPLMLMAGLFTVFTICFVLLFHTRYRRLEAEEQATYGSRPGSVHTVSNTIQGPINENPRNHGPSSQESADQS